MSIEELLKVHYRPTEYGKRIPFLTSFFEYYRSIHGDGVFDSDAFEKWKSNPHFVEQQIVDLIVTFNHLNFAPNVISLEMKANNSAVFEYRGETVIVIDEYMKDMLLSFLVCCLALETDDSKATQERVHKIILISLRNGLRKKGLSFSVGEEMEILINDLSDNVLHLLSDIYWATLVFVIGHELYHVLYSNDTDEIKADDYGYHTLLNLIQAQHEGEITGEYAIFYEEIHMAPAILMEYFRLCDYYARIFNLQVKDDAHPKPEIRFEEIIEKYKILPDWLDTTKGNGVLQWIVDHTDDIIHMI